MVASASQLLKSPTTETRCCSGSLGMMKVTLIWSVPLTASRFIMLIPFRARLGRSEHRDNCKVEQMIADSDRGVNYLVQMSNRLLDIPVRVKTLATLLNIRPLAGDRVQYRSLLVVFVPTYDW